MPFASFMFVNCEDGLSWYQHNCHRTPSFKSTFRKPISMSIELQIFIIQIIHWNISPFCFLESTCHIIDPFHSLNFSSHNSQIICLF